MSAIGFLNPLIATTAMTLSSTYRLFPRLHG